MKHIINQFGKYNGANPFFKKVQHYSGCRACDLVQGTMGVGVLPDEKGRCENQHTLDGLLPSLELTSKDRLNLRSVDFHVPSKVIIINSDLST